jgi:hypothetical protein
MLARLGLLGGDQVGQHGDRLAGVDLQRRSADGDSRRAEELDDE